MAKGGEDMLPVTESEMRRLIDEGHAAGKDMSHLEKELAEGIHTLKSPKCYKKIKGGAIISTGPVEEEDFEGL